MLSLAQPANVAEETDGRLHDAYADRGTRLVAEYMRRNIGIEFVTVEPQRGGGAPDRAEGS